MNRDYNVSMIIDITRPVHPGMAIYPGNPEVKFEQVAKATLSSSVLTRITLGSHTGTHIDAPSHIKEEAPGTDSYQLDHMVGAAEVIDLTEKERVILAADLPKTNQERVLIKTSNSFTPIDQFNPDFIALSDTAAAELIRRGVKLVGIDGPSIKKKGVRDNVHALLLEAGIIILEGLYLEHVTAGMYKLLCLPLAVQNLDGAPVRAVLRNLS